jgi:iron complex outermembrane receptor protein
VDASAASPDHAVTADPLGADRIEILRGPASLAYGGGATGGVVNVIDGLIVEKLPEKAFSGVLYGALTSVDDGKQAAGRINAKLGNFVAVVNASTLDTDDSRIPGYAYSAQKRADEIAGGASAADFARDKLPNSAVKDTSESFGLSWVCILLAAGLVVGCRIPPADADRASAEARPEDHRSLFAAVRKADNRYGIVGEDASYIDMHQTRYDFRGGLNFDSGFLKSVRASGSTVDYEHTEFEGPGEPGTVFTNTGWEARLEAAHASFNGLDGSFGVQLSDRDFAAVGEEALIGPTSTRQTGVYIFETYDAGQWGLEGGLRHDDVDIDNIAAGKKSFAAWNASAGAHVHLSDRIFLGFSVARTERAPTDVELFANGPHPATQQFEVGTNTLGTETGVNYELSARWEGDALNVSGSVYRFEFGDFIYLRDTGAADAATGLPIFQYDQRDANFTGAEITADLKLGTALGVDWKADAGADIVRAEFASGGYVPRIPAATVNVGLEGKKGGVSGRISAQYGAEQTRIAAFETPTGDYLTFDARAAFELTDHVQLILEAKNLTDEEVRLAASPLKDVAPQPGRNFRAALRATF